jgi:hypothetical protein
MSDFPARGDVVSLQRLHPDDRSSSAFVILTDDFPLIITLLENGRIFPWLWDSKLDTIIFQAQV